MGILETCNKDVNAKISTLNMISIAKKLSTCHQSTASNKKFHAQKFNQFRDFIGYNTTSI